MSSLFHLLFLSLFIHVKAINYHVNAIKYLNPGDYLRVEDPSRVLKSPNGTFTCGFYNISTTAFVFSIWFSNSANYTPVWTANLKQPVYGFGSVVKLRKHGNLVLKDYDGGVIWATTVSTRDGYRAELLDSGNLVIRSRGNSTLWQSFDYPTDTLLPNQPFTANTNLIAYRAPLSLDYYRFYFDDSYVLSLRYENPNLSSIYWPDPVYTVYGNARVTSISSRYASYDANGYFNSTDGLKFQASDLGPGIWRRLTLDPDGNLRLYSLNETDRSWSISWVALSQHCKIHGLCGINGICMYARQRPTCTCPPGYQMNDESDWSKGCSPVFNLMENSDEWFGRLPGTDYWGSDVNVTTPVSIGQCKKICRSYGTSCKGLQYHPGKGDCYIKDLLFNGKFRPGFPGDIYIKISRSEKSQDLLEPKVLTPSCKSTDPERMLPSPQSAKDKTPWSNIYWFLLALFVIELFFISFGCCFVFRKERNPLEKEEGYKLVSDQFRRYTYRELEKASNKFKDVIGRGGSGVVYKGVFKGGRVAALKKLDVISQGEEEFQSELSVIAQIYHMNLVTMWGYCSEKSHRILVTEYVENASLDKVLFDTGTASILLGWHQRYKIATGVAKGLAYLHHECLEWVIHCDVKPENILLEKDFEPKITDFGLAKLLHRNGDDSKLSRIRGTRGYIAPEWATNLPITAKVDVYSYGVVLLELVMGVRVSDWVIDTGEGVNMVLTGLARMLREKLAKDEPSCIVDIVDTRLRGDFNLEEVICCVKLATSCLEEEHSKRPSMNFVVQSLLFVDA